MRQEITLIEIKNIQIEILHYIKEICDRNNITYFLAFGTLLGAIRHRGFIPWDDDIDIAMPRKDYFKLMNIMNQDQSSRFKLISYHNNNKFTAPLPKIIDTETLLIQQYDLVEKVELGVYVDIFILDGLPGDKQEALSFFKRMEKLHYLWYLSDRKFKIKKNRIIKDFIKTIISVPFRILGPRYYIKKIDEAASSYDYESSKYVGALCFPTDGEKEVVPKDFFGKGLEAKFEGEFYRIPEKYEEYLRNFYGDYMKLPPKEQRVTHHCYEVYWR